MDCVHIHHDKAESESDRQAVYINSTSNDIIYFHDTETESTGYYLDNNQVFSNDICLKDNKFSPSVVSNSVIIDYIRVGNMATDTNNQYVVSGGL